MCFFKKFIIVFCIPFYIFSIEYTVNFSGLKDKMALSAISKTSDLIQLQTHPPKTINALKFRANNDKTNMLKVLKAFGYYDAQITIDLEEENGKIIVNVFISPGAQYFIKDVKIYDDTEKKELDVCDISLKKLSLPIDSPLITENVIEAQKKLIFLLSTCGYPLAKIKNREVIIDLSKKNASIEWYIDTGPFCKFGATKISGLKNIKQSYIDKKIKWKFNETYNSEKVIDTQQTLLGTNLFTSVAIIHNENIDENNRLKMNIKLTEALHKYFTTGISYATVDGFGASFDWGDNNFRSVGEILALEANVAQRMFLGVATYKKPDFMKPDQDYILRLEASRENIPVVYLAFTYTLANRIDRKFSKRFEASYSLNAEYDEITHSANDGRYALVSLPIHLKFTTTNNLLNPTKGYTIIYRASPYKNFIYTYDWFFKQTLTWNLYMPFEESRTIVLAVRMQFGSIIGPSVYKIPMTKLFLGGSDDDLRGYKYHTVSPLNAQYEPIGGRSAIYFSFEPRIRITQSLGLVPFTDLGVVSFKKLPQINEKWVKSVGLGLRYFSFFGPLRLDIGFPLDRRSQIDPRYKIYVNIGQTF
jgi:translocation and assembly module TamA